MQKKNNGNYNILIIVGRESEKPALIGAFPWSLTGKFECM